MTSALHAEGPRFDPGRVYELYSSSASIAQMVERKTLNLVVEGSSPSVGVYLFARTKDLLCWILVPVLFCNPRLPQTCNVDFGVHADTQATLDE